jgi:hypothetical protein
MWRVVVVGDVITHSLAIAWISSIAKFGIEFAFENVKDMSAIILILRAVACRVTNLAHPEIADGEVARCLARSERDARLEWHRTRLSP